MEAKIKRADLCISIFENETHENLLTHGEDWREMCLVCDVCKEKPKHSEKVSVLWVKGKVIQEDPEHSPMRTLENVRTIIKEDHSASLSFKSHNYVKDSLGLPKSCVSTSNPWFSEEKFLCKRRIPHNMMSQWCPTTNLGDKQFYKKHQLLSQKTSA